MDRYVPHPGVIRLPPIAAMTLPPMKVWFLIVLGVSLVGRQVVQRELPVPGPRRVELADENHLPSFSTLPFLGPPASIVPLRSR